MFPESCSHDGSMGCMVCMVIILIGKLTGNNTSPMDPIGLGLRALSDKPSKGGELFQDASFNNWMREISRVFVCCSAQLVNPNNISKVLDWNLFQIWV